MRAQRTSVSPDAIVSVSEAKTHLNLTSDTFDATLQQIIQSAEQALDGDRGALNSSVKASTWVLHLDGFPQDGQVIELPYGPVDGLTSVEYDDDNGLTQTFTGAHIKYSGRYACLRSWDGWPKDIKQKPTTEPVRITYTAGYATVPARIKQIALAMVLEMFDNRSQRIDSAKPANMWVATALHEYRF